MWVSPVTGLGVEGEERGFPQTPQIIANPTTFPSLKELVMHQHSLPREVLRNRGDVALRDVGWGSERAFPTGMILRAHSIAPKHQAHAQSSCIKVGN